MSDKPIRLLRQRHHNAEPTQDNFLYSCQNVTVTTSPCPYKSLHIRHLKKDKTNKNMITKLNVDTAAALINH